MSSKFVSFLDHRPKSCNLFRFFFPPSCPSSPSPGQRESLLVHNTTTPQQVKSTFTQSSSTAFPIQHRRTSIVLNKPLLFAFNSYPLHKERLDLHTCGWSQPTPLSPHRPPGYNFHATHKKTFEIVFAAITIVFRQVLLLEFKLSCQ